ncbi:preprotein translocase subunit SecA [Maridesulfovibrio frigidus]|uniref:preprotein translocase subunit SecA n=1 Tax=Maridesulfovibrio frigidus TaxID=340956 RepID=UPI00069202EE|nr:DEAD/DEAH box helicase [Maridesulfovibrio frigidus]
MSLPFEDRFKVQVPIPRKVHRGMDGLIHGVKRHLAEKEFSVPELLKRAELVVASSLELQDVRADELRSRLSHMRIEYRENGSVGCQILDDILTLVCELSFRSVGLRPYPVQLLGALVIHDGGLAEMATGEGKSLASAVAAVLMSSAGKPVHVLTSNDYLAERDAEEMTPLFIECGLRVGFVTGETPHPERAKSYLPDVVYTTGKELLGDYLRDRIKVGDKANDLGRAIVHTLMPERSGKDGLALRGLYAVIIDEADSVLVDEAVTPLILSAPRENISLEGATLAAWEGAKGLEKDVHYKINWQYREIFWTPQGEKQIKFIAASLPKIWQGSERSRELLTLALQSREMYLQDEHYVVLDGKIVLLDTLTGRLTPHKNLGIGLHQALEAKEEVDISPPTKTLAKMSYQRFFRLFPKIGGMSGTVKEAGPEFWRVYHMPFVQIPTHRPIIRKELPWRFYLTADEKLKAIVKDVAKLHTTGQPILIGTRTVHMSELLATMFEEAGICCEVLNAVRHSEEARIVADGGRQGAVTIATNMAGRGTDIKLQDGVVELGGLCVISVEPQDSARVDRQLFGRSGRQGDPGCVLIYGSLEDVLFTRILPRFIIMILKKCCSSNKKGGTYILQRIVGLLQSISEQRSAAQRLAILRNDDWLEKSLSLPGA